MPRLVRRQPLIERVKSLIDPYDLLLWLSEELNDDAYDEWLKLWATPIGAVINVLFIFARISSKAGISQGGDDVFGDDGSNGSGWFAWMAHTAVLVLTFLCCLNALFTFFRRRSYRLFEQPVDIAPATPSATRVRVDSSPLSASPLRYLQSVITAATAQSRAYPDAEREVWELNIWDPKPFNLAIFTLFSPGHLVVYYLLLPAATMDPRPSVTAATAIAFGLLLSAQLWLLRTSFSQQAKDSTLIHGQVMNEYDTKFVHPTLNRPVRDVGIQTRVSGSTPRNTRSREVDVYTPTTIVKRGFITHPNPNYAKQYDPDDLTSARPESRRSSGMANIMGTRNLEGPLNGDANAQSQPQSRPGTSADFSSPLKPHHERLRERSVAKGDGGSLGVYSHAASPLRKAASSNQLRASREEMRKAAARPLKRMSVSGYGGVDYLEERRGDRH